MPESRLWIWLALVCLLIVGTPAICEIWTPSRPPWTPPFEQSSFEPCLEIDPGDPGGPTPPLPNIKPGPGYENDGVNVRSGPTASSSIGDANIIGKLRGNAVPIGQFGREAAGTWWWKIRYNDEHEQVIEGWVRSDVVIAEGDISFPPPKPWISPFDPGVTHNITWEFGDNGHNGIDITSNRKASRDWVTAMADGTALVFPDVNKQYDKGTYWINVLHEHPDGKIYWVQYTHIAQKDRNPNLRDCSKVGKTRSWWGTVPDSSGFMSAKCNTSVLSRIK